MIESYESWRAAMARAFEAAPSLILIASHQGKLILACGRFRELGKPAINDNISMGFAEAEPAFGGQQ